METTSPKDAPGRQKRLLERRARPSARRRGVAIFAFVVLAGGCLLLPAAPFRPAAPAHQVDQAACGIGVGGGATAGPAATRDMTSQGVCRGEGVMDPVVAKEGGATVAVAVGDAMPSTAPIVKRRVSGARRFSSAQPAHAGVTLANGPGRPQEVMAQACVRMAQIVRTACSFRTYARDREEGIQRCMAYELRYTMWSAYDCR